MTDAEWRAAVAAGLAARHGPAARVAVADRSALVPRADEEAVALLLAVRAVVPVALLSDATTRLEAGLAAPFPPGLADTVVNAARVGVAEPDPRAFLPRPTRSVCPRTAACSPTTSPLATARRRAPPA